MTPNSPYEEDSGTLGSLMTAGILGTGAAALGFYAYDKKKFMEVGTKAVNFIYPKVAAEKSTSAKVADRMYEAMSTGSAKANPRNKILNKFREDLAGKNAEKYELIRHDLDAAQLSASKGRAGKQYFNKLEEVVDEEGSPIGQELMGILESIGIKGRFEGFQGTNAIVDVGGYKLNVPFSKYDESSKAWVETRIQEGTHSRWVHSRKYDIVDTPKGLGAEVMDPNTHILESLRDIKKRGIVGSLDFDMARDYYKSLEGKGVTKSDIEKMMAVTIGEQAGLVGSQTNLARMLAKVLKGATETAQNIQGVNPAAEALAGSELEATFFGRLKLSDKAHLKGIDSVAMGTSQLHSFRPGEDAFNPDIQRLLYGMGEGIRGNPDLMTFKTKTMGAKAVNPNFQKTKSFLQKHFGFVGPQKQVADLSANARENLYGIYQAEGDKAFKGISFANRNKPSYFGTTQARYNPGMFTNNYMESPHLQHMRLGGNLNLLGTLDPTTDQAIEVSRWVDLSVKRGKNIYVDDFIKRLTVPKLEYREEMQEDGTYKKVKFENFYAEEAEVNYITKSGERRVGSIGSVYKKIAAGDIDVQKLTMKKGTHIGVNRVGRQLTGDIAKDEEIVGRESLVRAEAMFEQDEEDILRTLESRALRQELGYDGWILHGKYIEDTTKLLAHGQSTRAAVTRMYSPGKDEFRMSLNYYEKALLAIHGPKGGTGPTSEVIGKNVGAALPFMQDALRGHLLALDNNLTLTGDAASRFSQYLTGNRTGDLNLSEIAKTEGLQFQISDNPVQQFLDVQNLVGLQRHAGMDTSIGSLDDLGYMGEKVVEDLNALNTTGKAKILAHRNTERLVFEGLEYATNRLGPRNYNKMRQRGFLNYERKFGHDYHALEGLDTNFWLATGFSPQETESLAQGIGSNTMRIGFRDMQYLRDTPGVMEELSLRSIIDTPRLMEQQRLMEMSIAGEDVSAFTDAKLVDVEELKKIMGPYGYGDKARRNIQDPLHFLDSFLSSNNNPNGFLLQAHDRQVFIPGNDYFKGGYYMPEEDKVALSDFSWKVHELLNDVVNSPQGELSKSGLEALAYAVDIHGHSTKGGILREASLHVPGAYYSMNTPDVNFLSEKSSPLTKLEKMVEDKASYWQEAQDLHYAIGNVTKVSKETYAASIDEMLSEAMSAAESNNVEVKDVLRDWFGEGNFFEQNLDVAGIESRESLFAWQNDTLHTVGSMMAEAKIAKGKELEWYINKFLDGGGGFYSKEAMNIIDKEGLTGMVTRYPAIYAKSMALANIFPDWDQKNPIQGKSLALGHAQRLLMNADHDGDKIQLLTLFGSKAKAERLAEINGNQKTVFNFMNAAGNRSAIGTLFPDMRFQSFAKMGDKEVEAMFESASHLEVNTGIAAWLTKGLTGAFSAQTFQMKGGLEGLVDGRIAEDTFSKYRTFIHTFVPKFWEQSIISSKHIQSILGPNGVEATMDNVLKAMGNITDEGYVNLLRNSGGEMSPILAHAAIAARKSGTSWMAENAVRGTEMWNASNHLADLTYNIRELNFDEYGVAHRYSGATTKVEDAFAEYQRAIKNTPTIASQFSKDEAEALGFNGGFLNMLSKGIDEGAGAGTSDSIGGMLNSLAKRVETGKTNKEDIPKIIMDHMHRSKLIDANIEMTVAETLRRSYVPPSRKFAGVDKAWKFIEDHVTLPRMIGAGAAALAGLAMWNLATDDGAIEDPNDLPSVNNPAFQAPRSQMGSQRTLQTKANYNTSMNLLTDSREAMSTIGNIVSSRGYNTVHTRQDGSNPYKEDMYRYS
jgi:hypothetical protein